MRARKFASAFASLLFFTLLCAFAARLARTTWAQALDGVDGQVMDDRFPNKDRYANYEELARHETEGESYRVTASLIGDPFLILAIHGGGIEPGSEELARLLAGSNHSLYVFSAEKPGHDWDLHITATNFDEPRALHLVQRSSYCISLHGYADDTVSAICLGGGNTELRGAMKQAFAESGLAIQIRDNCPKLEGLEPTNIVNRCSESGVQLEMSAGLRHDFLRDPELESGLAATISSVLLRASGVTPPRASVSLGPFPRPICPKDWQS